MDCLRIFVDPSRLIEIPAYRLHVPLSGRQTIDNTLTIFTDGFCINNGKYNTKCRGGIWIKEHHPMNQEISMPGMHHSNQIGELVAVLVALQNTNPITPVKIVTDSKYVINGLNTHLDKWENARWINMANTQIFKAIAYQLRRQSAPTSFQWVKGHSQVTGNERADHLAQNGASKTTTNIIGTYIPQNFDLQGARMSKVDQKTAYRVLMTKKHIDYKRPTLGMLDITRYAIETLMTTLEMDETIWQGCRNNNISKKIQVFLYKTLNNAFRIGDFWMQLPNLGHRAQCQSCGEEPESMEHILIQCTNPIRKRIWHLAKNLWPEKHGPWPEPSLGLILGCGNISLPKNAPNRGDNDKKCTAIIKGASCLLRILISELAYLIWVIRCECVIREQAHTDEHTITQWTNTINHRLQLDRVVACKTKRSTKKTSQVYHTWADVITTNNDKYRTGKDWVTALEVLVGIKLPRPPQTEVSR
ncbi:ribonuclease H-like protein [Suillus hirtellus]|nr:ribonuclease H-like protein [Suillus hirtellus]